MNEIRLYTDIGHAHPDKATIWLFSGGTLTTQPATLGTHESLFGPDAVNCWRGRYERESRRCSIAPPAADMQAEPPPWVIDALAGKWGEIQFYYFGFNRQF